MKIPRSITRLADQFEKLPGVGPKTAQRLVYYLLNVPQPYLDEFGEALTRLKKDTVRCSVCFQIGNSDPCEICTDEERDQQVICVVEQPLDVLAIERSGSFNGLYHVLHGVISPLDHIGPEELYIAQLLKRISSGSLINEIILGMNPTMEGEATALYLLQEIKKILSHEENTIRVTRLAQGLPLGGDVEYADAVTLERALTGRRELV